MNTRVPVSDRDRLGLIQRDIDLELLSLVSSGCDVGQIVRELRLPLREVHQRLVSLRRVIESVSQNQSR